MTGEWLWSTLNVEYYFVISPENCFGSNCGKCFVSNRQVHVKCLILMNNKYFFSSLQTTKIKWRSFRNLLSFQI